MVRIQDESYYHIIVNLLRFYAQGLLTATNKCFTTIFKPTKLLYVPCHFTLLTSRHTGYGTVNNTLNAYNNFTTIRIENHNVSFILIHLYAFQTFFLQDFPLNKSISLSKIHFNNTMQYITIVHANIPIYRFFNNAEHQEKNTSIIITIHNS